jgi:hypothetical protein
MVSSLLLAAIPAGAGELCFTDEATYWPCTDYILMPRWIGFRTDSTACRDTISHPEGGVALSASSTDPFVNEGPLEEDRRLYLWNTPIYLQSASAGYGFAVDLQIVGDLSIEDYEPMAPGDHQWNAESRHFFYGGCGEDLSEVIGAFVIRPTPVERTSWGRIKAGYR